ncbi:DUF4286 family protein [Mesonia aestuariivivens]|uniref:DUF4286 family protein n=1 Tax=Mesonia aestuariivivens TaxID=2796128 RepID=A0ABS6W259_9FLAO|nr:DUF4286 family protein [Mesonia aestuariivivens]MBW2961941.1 DUF4286 family protein [Mesonia aestuariivivens]
MIIYNVTINVSEEVHSEWLTWMQQEHIPQMLATGKFKNAIMTKVLVEEPMGGVTYSIQYKAENKATLQRYYEEDAEKLRKEAQRFKDKTVFFRTELEVISEQ